MESGKEQNYWPGFVDALSNVVLTLVFVLVIFVFALLMASNKVAKKMEETAAAEKAHNEAQAELNKALTELEQLRTQQAQSAKPAGESPQQACLYFAKSDNAQKTETDATSILITFTANAISLTDDTTKAIHGFIESMRTAVPGATKFVIESPDDPSTGSPLMARETQLGRMLNVRNALLSGKIESRSISVHAIPPLQEKGGYDWVRIHVEK